MDMAPTTRYGDAGACDGVLLLVLLRLKSRLAVMDSLCLRGQASISAGPRRPHCFRGRTQATTTQGGNKKVNSFYQVDSRIWNAANITGFDRWLEKTTDAADGPMSARHMLEASHMYVYASCV